MDIEISRLNPITIKSLRDYILDNDIGIDKVIILHTYNFDDIILEHLDFYKSSATFPYKIIGVLIEEDPFHKIHLNNIGVINDYDYNFNYPEDKTDTDYLNYY